MFLIITKTVVVAAALTAMGRQPRLGADRQSCQTCEAQSWTVSSLTGTLSIYDANDQAYLRHRAGRVAAGSS